MSHVVGSGRQDKEKGDWVRRTQRRTGRAVLLALIHVVFVLARRRRLEGLAINKIELQEGRDRP